MKRSLLILQMLLLLLLSACGQLSQPESTDTQPQTTGIRTDTPAFTDANYVAPVELKLTGLAPEDRCALTSNGKMAETEAGYFIIRHGAYLFYADKTNLNNWVLVCERPECLHDRHNCSAAVGSFWLKENDIYYLGERAGQSLLDMPSIIKLSMADFTQEVVFSDPLLDTSSGATWSDEKAADAYYSCISRLNEDGSTNCAVVRINDSGATSLYSVDYSTDSQLLLFAMPMSVTHSIRGDMMIASKIPLDGTPDENTADMATRSMDRYYHVNGDSIQEVILSDDCSIYGAFISGNLLYHYHVNDGFYRMDLSTGEEVKFADAAYENAYGHCVDGQLMIECTMSVPGTASEAQTPQMRYFDGKQWHELALPETWTMSHEFRVIAGTSDRIFITVNDSNRYDMCMIDLGYIMIGEDTLTLCDQYPADVHFD